MFIIGITLTARLPIIFSGGKINLSARVSYLTQRMFYLVAVIIIIVIPVIVYCGIVCVFHVLMYINS